MRMGIVYKKADAAAAATAIAAYLAEQLKSATILLSLSGGSAIAAEIKLLRSLGRQPNLWVTLNDERYGPVGHPDSNWTQLAAAGLDKLDVSSYAPLQGLDAPATLAAFNGFLGASASFDRRVSILGMGTDGHTSGILPASPATRSRRLACYYAGPDHKRLTNTFGFLKRQDEIFVLAYGTAKHAQIDRLATTLEPSQQPIQIIKQVSRVTFYNDLKGDEG